MGTRAHAGPFNAGRGAFYDRVVLALNRITFACDDSRLVAEFWAGILGYELDPSGGGWLARGEGPDLFFKRMPKSPTIEVPIHLDINVPDMHAEVRRALDLGARGIVETKTSAVGTLIETFTVVRDPEGNGFCIQPDARTTRPYVGNVTFSSADPPLLGRFWSTALGWPEEEDDESFLQMLREARLDPDEFTTYYAARNPDGSRPRFLFQRREKSRPEHYPLHLDFTTDDRAGELERLTAAGATVVQTKTDEHRTWTLMRDPEGNPFCVE